MAKISGITKYKTGNGIRYKVNTKESGRTIKKNGFQSQEAAKKWLENQRKVFSKKSSSDMAILSFQEFQREYEELHLPCLKFRTRNRYQVDLRLRIGPEFQGMKLDQITPKHISQFRSRLQQNLSPKSVNNCIGTLSAMFSKAIEWDYLDVNPVKLKPLRVARSSDENWWKDQSYIHQFMEALETDDAWGNGTREGFKEPYRAALIMPLEVGARLGEVCCLLRSDIDFHGCTISISKTYDDKQHAIVPTKNYETRILRFQKDSRLHRWLEEACGTKMPADHVFTTRTGKMVLPSKLANEVFRKWNSRLGLPRITFHGLRHTFATWYLKRGGEIYTLYKTLGHKDIGTTMKLYYHHTAAVFEPMSWDEKPRRLSLVKK